MANPFDEVINLKEERRESSSSKSRQPRDAINISLSINKRIFIHLAYIIVILFLVFLLFRGGIDTEKQVKVPEQKQPVPNVTTPPVVEQVVVPEPEVVENLTNTTPETTLADLKLVMGTIGWKKLDGNMLKIDDVSFTIVNGYKDFTPLVKIYWYDRLSTAEMRAKVRASPDLLPLSKGTNLPYAVNQFTGKLTETGELQEIIKIELYDRVTSELLKSVNTTIP
ncbi:MAG: hypothetical protein Q7S65_03955 [Nanoarchaeota archaeon]|nr:hypothetical protein [Nanoarchaeota archaeon]